MRWNPSGYVDQEAAVPDPSRAHEPGSVDPPKITLISLAAMAERAQSLQRTAPSWRAKVQCSGRRRFADGVLAHVRTPGGPTSSAQPLFRLTRSPPTPCRCPSLTRSNRRGTDPYARWWGRGGIARCPPIPIFDPFRSFGPVYTIDTGSRLGVSRMRLTGQARPRHMLCLPSEAGETRRFRPFGL